MKSFLARNTQMKKVQDNTQIKPFGAVKWVWYPRRSLWSKDDAKHNYKSHAVWNISPLGAHLLYCWVLVHY